MNFVKAIPPRLLHDKGIAYQREDSWNADMDRCWIDNDNDICVTSRMIRTKFGNVEHVAITKGKGTCNGENEITWSQKMQIKDMLFGENRFAIEVFPKRKQLIDAQDVYHLWVFDKKLEMPFGIGRGEYQKAVNRGYCITVADYNAMIDDYQRTGKL